DSASALSGGNDRGLERSLPDPRLAADADWLTGRDCSGDAGGADVEFERGFQFKLDHLHNGFLQEVSPGRVGTTVGKRRARDDRGNGDSGIGLDTVYGPYQF